MKIVAYAYQDPLYEPVESAAIWGWEVDQVYLDIGERNQRDILLKNCQNQQIDYLLIRQPQELGTSVEEVGQYLAQLEEFGVQTIFTESALNLQDFEFKAKDLLLFFSELNKEQHSRKLRQAYARNRLKALPPPGKAPYGYRRTKDKYILDRSTYPIVKDFFEHFLLYGSLRGAVRFLQQKYGKKISVTTGRQWLRNPVYRGDLAYKTGEVISNTHPPIISRQEAAQIERILRRNAQIPPRTCSSSRSLSGLVICGICQSAMTIVTVTAYRKAGEYVYLRPTHCNSEPKCKSIVYQEVLNQSVAKICQELPAAVAELPMTKAGEMKDRLTAEIIQKQEIIEQLPALKNSGILDEETEQLRAYKLRSEITQLQTKIDQLPPLNLQSIAQAVSIPQFWLDLSESERRFYFREFIRRIEIVPSQENWDLRLVFVF